MSSRCEQQVMKKSHAKGRNHRWELWDHSDKIENMVPRLCT